MNILSSIRDFFTKLTPTAKRTRFDVRQQPTGVAARADVGRIHSLFEAADAGDPRELFALYQEIVLGDSHLQSEFSKRKLALLGDTMTVISARKGDKDADAAAELVNGMLMNCASFLDAAIHLMDGVLWPVAVVEKVFKAQGSGYVLADLVPVPDQLLDFSLGRLRIRLTSDNGIPAGAFEEADERRYIVHRGHLLTTPDSRGGPMRSLVWWWLLSTMDREWWSRFLERYGSPFLLGKYEQADDASRSILERAFAYATKIGGLVVSKETNVELVQAAAGNSGDAYEKFLMIAQREKSKLVVGQTLSGDTQAQGIGGGATALHAQVREDIRQWDAIRLGDTFRRQLFTQLLQINGMAGEAPKLMWGGEDSGQQQATGELLKSLSAAGLRLTDAGITTLSDRLGMPLERSAAPAPTTLGARAHLLVADGLPVDDAGDRIARAGSADLSRAFRGAFAPVRLAILESSSAEDLEIRLRLLYADYPAERLAAIIEPALVAFAANGLS